MRRFFIGFCSGLALFVVLNAAPYFLASAPQLRTLGILSPFWRQDPTYLTRVFVPSQSGAHVEPQFYWDKLQGEKLIRYVANGDHSLKDTDALQSITAFYYMIINNKPLPKYSWTFESDGSIKVKYQTPPSNVVLWQATNAKARDFRVDSIGKAYTSTELKQETDGSYVGKITPPKEGWSAFFVELTYDVGGPFPLKVTTAVRVLPDVLPFKGVNTKELKYEGELFPEKMKKK